MPTAAVTDADVLAGYAADASGLAAVPTALFRPETVDEVAAVVVAAARGGLKLTPQGGRTSTTGSAVPEQSAALALEKLAGVEGIDPVGRTATVLAGTNLGAFKRAVADHGLWYPPDPTSENECTVGGSLACNASGPRTLAYGPTRAWVAAVEVVLASGEIRWFARRTPSKNTAGYGGAADLVDLFVGSEGTLGVVTRARLTLLPTPAFTAGLVFFDSLDAALAFVPTAVQGPSLRPRCLELFDARSLALIRARDPAIAAHAAAALFFEQETGTTDSADSVLARWAEAIDQAPGALPAQTLIATNETEKRALRTLRHHLPAGMNELGAKARAAGLGGRKVSTDWCVPLARLDEMMAFATDLCEREAPGPWLSYGHIGNGHPHFNLIAHDRAELEICESIHTRMIDRALALGGTFSAEHGIGKLKRRFLPAMLAPEHRAVLAAVRQTLDPTGLFAPGNLF